MVHIFNRNTYVFKWIIWFVLNWSSCCLGIILQFPQKGFIILITYKVRIAKGEENLQQKRFLTFQVKVKRVEMIIKRKSNAFYFGTIFLQINLIKLDR